MAEGDLEIAHATMEDQSPAPPVLDYHTPEPSTYNADWWRRLPRPSWFTVIVLLITVAAAIWLDHDHAAWVVVRQFDGYLPVTWPSLAISTDGKRLLAILADNQTIRVYDTATRNIIRDLHRPSGDVSTATFSPDGCRIWSIGTDQQAILWDMPTGKPLASLPIYDRDTTCFGSATGSPFSADGRWVVAADEHVMRICDGRSGAVQAEVPTGRWVEYPVFSPDGRYLAGRGVPPHALSIWDTQTWQRIASFNPVTRIGIGGWGLAFSPDSKTLAIAACPQTFLWDASTNQVTPAFTVAGQVAGCMFSPDGRYLLTINDDGPEELWDVTLPASKSGPCLRSLAAWR